MAKGPTPLMKPAEFANLVRVYGESQAFAHAVTRWDRREEDLAARNPRRYHNKYALGLMLIRIDEMLAENLALSTCFNGPLLTYLEGLQS